MVHDVACEVTSVADVLHVGDAALELDLELLPLVPGHDLHPGDLGEARRTDDDDDVVLLALHPVLLERVEEGLIAGVHQVDQDVDLLVGAEGAEGDVQVGVHLLLPVLGGKVARVQDSTEVDVAEVVTVDLRVGLEHVLVPLGVASVRFADGVRGLEVVDVVVLECRGNELVGLALVLGHPDVAGVEVAAVALATRATLVAEVADVALEDAGGRTDRLGDGSPQLVVGVDGPGRRVGTAGAGLRAVVAVFVAALRAGLAVVLFLVLHIGHIAVPDLSVLQLAPVVEEEVGDDPQDEAADDDLNRDLPPHELTGVPVAPPEGVHRSPEHQDVEEGVVVDHRAELGPDARPEPEPHQEADHDSRDDDPDRLGGCKA